MAEHEIVKHKTHENCSRKEEQKKRTWQCLEVDGGD